MTDVLTDLTSLAASVYRKLSTPMPEGDQYISLFFEDPLIQQCQRDNIALHSFSEIGEAVPKILSEPELGLIAEGGEREPMM